MKSTGALHDMHYLQECDWYYLDSVMGIVQNLETEKSD